MTVGARVRRSEAHLHHIYGVVVGEESGHDRWLVRWDQRLAPYEISGEEIAGPHFCIERGEWLEVISPLKLLAEQSE